MYAVVETSEIGRSVILSTFDEDSLSRLVYAFCMEYMQARSALRWDGMTQEWFDSLPNKLEIWSVCGESFNIDSSADFELTFSKLKEMANETPTIGGIIKKILTTI